MSDSILIIGGGIAGINCALNAAKYGAKVYLVDDTPSIGGLMARLDKTFPTNDCSICIEAPKMYEVATHPTIEILTNSVVRKGKGAAVGPVAVPHELDAKIGGTRKLISSPFPQAVPNTYVVDGRCRDGKMRD